MIFYAGIENSIVHYLKLKSSCGDHSDKADKGQAVYMETEKIVDICSRKKHAYFLLILAEKNAEGMSS